MKKETKNKRQLQAEQTKDKLFFAADALLKEKSFLDIKIRDIVAKANVSIGTFYHYYSTKMDVFYETYRVADQYFSKTVRPQLTQPTAYERILKFFEWYAFYSSELTSPELIQLLYNPNNKFFNRDPQGGMVGVLIEVLRDGLDSGELKGEDTAEQMAEYLMIAARGLVYNWCTAERSYNLTDAMLRFVTRLMKAYL